MRNKFVGYVGRRVGPASMVLLVLSVSPWFHEQWNLIELPGHFRPHIAVAATMIGLVAVFMRRQYAATSALLAAAVCWTIILTVPTASALDGRGVRIVSQNLGFMNNEFARAATILESEGADVLVLQEYSPEWHQSLSTGLDRYPSRITVPIAGAFGIAIYSRLPIKTHQVISAGSSDAPVIAAEFDTPRFRAHIVGVHFMPPTSTAWSNDRNRQLSEIREYLQALGKPFVLIGDFNNTPVSPSMDKFLGDTAWHLAPPHWLPTWPSGLHWFGIPIDLAIGSEHIRFGNKALVPPIGSDHRGIRIDATVSNENAAVTADL